MDTPDRDKYRPIVFRRGFCEKWTWHRLQQLPCGKRGRWLVNGQVRCGEHRDK